MKPVVYGCAGSSSAAQLANHLAVRLDRAGKAKMSCIAGVGGDVEPLVRVARSGRPVVAIDGCPLHCVKACLARHGVEASLHVTLADLGVAKKNGVDFDPLQADAVFTDLASRLDALEPPRRQG
jgi:uncharacterized metal-binding protein